MTNYLAAELRNILDDLHDAEHGAVPKPLVRERLTRLAEHVEKTTTDVPLSDAKRRREDLHSGPANVSPAGEPYEPVEGERWRVGRKVGKNLYAEPPDGAPGQDIGRMDTPELAAFVCDAVNDHLIAIDRRREREEEQ